MDGKFQKLVLSFFVSVWSESGEGKSEREEMPLDGPDRGRLMVMTRT